MTEDSINDIIREIKHDFMAFRNGIIADSLRKVGYDHEIIFGLQIPDISNIARKHNPSKPLAFQLFNDSKVRESRLLSFHLFPKDEMTKEEIEGIMRNLKTREEAEILSFRLLRFLPFASEILEEAPKVENGKDNDSNYLHCLEMLRRHISHQ